MLDGSDALTHVVHIWPEQPVACFYSGQPSWKRHQADCGGLVQTWVQGPRPRGQMDQWWVMLQTDCNCCKPELFGWIRLRLWQGWNTSTAGLQEISASGCNVACLPLITVKTVIRLCCELFCTSVPRLIITRELFSNLSDSLVNCLRFLSTTASYRTYIYTNTLNLTWHEWHLDWLPSVFCKSKQQRCFCSAAQGWHLSLPSPLLCNWDLLMRQASSSVLKEAAKFYPSFTFHLVRRISGVWISFPSQYLRYIDSSFGIRGSYAKPARLWLEINRMKWSARESDYGLLWGWRKITIQPRERMDRIVALQLSVCLLSCRLVCLFWLSSPLPINCVTLSPRLRAREGGKAFLSINISFPGDIFPLSSQRHLIPRADLRLDRESAGVVRWGSQKNQLYRVVCGWMGQNRPQTNGGR